jgi:hypothetical protein
MAGVDLIEGREVIQVCEEAGRLDGHAERRASVFEQTRQALHDAFGLALDIIAGDLLGLRVDRDNAGGEDEATGFDGLGIWSDRGGGLA